MRRVMAVSLAGCLLVAGCSGGSSSSSGSGDAAGFAANGTFTMSVASDPGGFDPLRTRGVLGLSVIAYDSLVNQLPDGKFVSGLAEKWTAEPRSATFTLRKGITCSDGTPLTATDVAESIRYVSDPKNTSPQYGVNTPTVPLTATADDTAGTVKVATSSAYGFLLNTVGLVPVVCAKGRKDPKMLATASDGTGPFVMTQAVPGQSYTFTVRKDYTWGPDGAATSAPGTPSSVVVKVIPNETTAANLLLSGELNLAKVTGDADAKRLEARGLKKQDWQVGGAWLSFNQRGRPTADQRVRRALLAGVDLDEVVKVSTAGAGGVPGSLLALKPPGCTGDTVKGQLPKHDPAGAGTLLDQAGWAEGGDGFRAKDGKRLTIDLHYLPTQSTLDKPTAELLSQKWRALGAEVALSADAPSKAVDVLYKTGDYDVYISGYNFNLPSQMVPYLSGPGAPNGNNLGGVNNKDYNTLVTKAEALMPPDACEYWNQAEQAIVRGADLAPISNRAEHWFSQRAEVTVQRYNSPIPTTIRMLG